MIKMIAIFLLMWLFLSITILAWTKSNKTEKIRKTKIILFSLASAAATTLLLTGIVLIF